MAANDQEIAYNRPGTQARREIVARLRRQRHVECLHRLGPAPLGHFIREIEAGADVTATLELYAGIDPAFVAALGGDKFPPPFLRAIEPAE